MGRTSGWWPQRRTMIKSTKPIISVCAVRTGAGKSQTSRYIANYLRSKGIKVSIVRHPMPYGILKDEIVERFRTLKDLDRYKTTIEEREDYEPHIRNGFVVFAGVDYEKILRAAEKESDVIIWDGGNNDASFYKPDLSIAVLDPLRAGNEIGVLSWRDRGQDGRRGTGKQGQFGDQGGAEDCGEGHRSDKPCGGDDLCRFCCDRGRPLARQGQDGPDHRGRTKHNPRRHEVRSRDGCGEEIRGAGRL